ncbi:Colanic acid biosynthesis protein [Escherichia coli]|uniref:Colanic acid biosynthesis protein n=1 Tax=Escherichia coli TaxID=562 RepID=A0A376RH51_ECOLX|nr:Colanic acid biosynthesis protein [Escherichia coli]
MKLLILGNHTCGNRGDSAILRGLLDAINILNPHAEVDVMSRYPVSSSWLLNRPVMGDPLFLQMKQHNSAAGVVGRVKKVLRRRYQHQVLLSRVTDSGKLRNIAMPRDLLTCSPAFRLRCHYPGRRIVFCRSLRRAAV